MNPKIKNALSVVLAIIIAFLIVKFSTNTILSHLSEYNKIIIAIVSWIALFILLMFVFKTIIN